MPISEQDIKFLWGKAAGRCSWCNKDLFPELKPAGVQGDMAHIIAKSSNGPRGSKEAKKCDLDKYDNLILLCPNDHRAIDSNPNDYTVEQILKKKAMHEENIRSVLDGKKFQSASEMFKYSLKLLNENKSILDQFGPSSAIAKRNPGSGAKRLWDLGKLGRIIPNNNEIISIFEKNENLITVAENLIFNKFKVHATAFEANTWNRLDKEAVPVFPTDFREMLEGARDE